MSQPTNLRHAILSGDVGSVQERLQNGADINGLIDDKLPLTFSISNGEEDVAIFLAENGADISLKPFADDEDVAQANEPEAVPSVPDMTGKGVASYIALLFLIEWIEDLAVTGLCNELLQSDARPITFRPYLRAISSQTAFGHTLRSMIYSIARAVCSGTLVSTLRTHAQSVPACLFMFIVFQLSHSRSGDADQLPRSFPWQVWAALYQSLWCKAVAIFWLVTQGITWAVVSTVYSVATRRAPPPRRRFGGSEALDAILSDGSDCDRIALALLDNNIFSAEYLQKSLEFSTRYPESHNPYNVGITDYGYVRRLWDWTIDKGHEQIFAKLLDLGINPWEPISHGDTLGHAAVRGHRTIVEALLQRIPEKAGADSHFYQKKIGLALVRSARSLTKSLEESSSTDLQVFNILLERVHNVNIVDDYQMTALMYAVREGNVAAVESLLSRGGSPHKTDTDGKTPILYLRSDDTGGPICDLLLNAGANINHVDDQGYTILLRQAQLSNTAIVKKLLNSGADPSQQLGNGQTAMHLAARYCMDEMIDDLLKAGAQVEYPTVSTETPLMLACHCHYERSPTLRLLLANGANPNVVNGERKTPLHLVCYQYSTSSTRKKGEVDDHLESIRVLLDAGADVNAAFEASRSGKTFEVTALGISAANGSSRTRYPALELLLGAGASPNAVGNAKYRPDFCLAIVSASKEGRRADSDSDVGDCVELLLQHGADLHHCDDDGTTLVHHAASNNNYSAISTLSKRGLETDLKDRFGRTPLHLACKNRYWTTTTQNAAWVERGMYSGCQEYADWHCSIESSLTMFGLLTTSSASLEKDKHGCVPAHIAAKAGNPRTLAMLLLHHGSGQVYDLRDRYGRLPFHYAAASTEATRVLLHYHRHRKVETDKYFQVLDIPSDNLISIASHFANEIWGQILERKYKESHPEEVIDYDGPFLPLRRGTCNSKDHLGNTPLHYAGLAGNVDVVNQYLEMPDVNPHVVNNDGEFPLDFAMENRECALAIAARLAEVGINCNYDELAVAGPSNKTRQSAEEFVQGLKKTC